MLSLLFENGYIVGSVALTSGFPDGTGQIWLDNVQCVGTETKLIECFSNILGVHNCLHSEDAGIRCVPATSEFQ